MEIDHLRPHKHRLCTYCKKPGHDSKFCRSRPRHIQAVEQNRLPTRPPFRREPYADWKAKIECWNCSKLGHLMRDCNSNPNNKYRKN